MNNILIVHNILWSEYKAGVFNAIFEHLRQRKVFALHVVHLAETETERIGLGAANLSLHQYPYTVLNKLPLDAVGRLARAWRFFGFLRGNSYDVIAIPGWGYLECWIAWIYALIGGKQLACFVDSTHGDKRRFPPLEFVKRLFLRQVSLALCYGERSRDYLMRLGVAPDNIIIRCQAAYLPPEFKVPWNDLKNKWEAPSTLSFLFVGRLSPEKDIERILQAIYDLKTIYDISVHLNIVGAGPCHQDLVALVQEKRLSENVNFVGGLGKKAVCEYYKKAHFLLLPSKSEAWGLVVNEAMAFGVICIVANACGCVPELIRNESTGFLLKDADNLAGVMKASMEVNLIDLQKMAEKGYRLIQEFSSDKAALQIIGGFSRYD